jgi:LacI family transcriptional regulator
VVAALAGVSTAAVSRYINGKQRFTAAVEQRIREAIAQVGYRTSPAARSLATGRSGAVAVLVAGIEDPHTAALVKGISRVALAERLDVMFVDCLYSAAPERELQRVLGLQVDGVLLATAMPAAATALLQRSGRPCVDTLWTDAEGASPWANDEMGAALLAHYLVRRGFRRISYIDSPALAGHARRRQGLQRVLDAERIALVVHSVPEASAEAGAAVASTVLLQTPSPEAVVACSDELAMGLLGQAALLGLQVPRDVAVAGIGNMPLAPWLNPALTSVELHADALGAWAMHALLAQLRGQPSPSSVPPAPQLMVRESTAHQLPAR